MKKGFFIFYVSISFLLLYSESRAELTDTAVQLIFPVPPANNVQRGDVSQEDRFTGALSYTFPIEAPPGRKGLAPKLDLTYRSSNGNGWVGMGWELEVGAIERKTRLGLDYGSTDFILKMPGYSTELVPVSGGEYRAKIEGKFYRIVPRTQGWVIYDKSGVLYFFGETSASVQDNPANTSQVFKWCLDKILEPNGNFINFIYSKDTANGQIYLDRIEYTGWGAISPTNYIKFNLEAGRQDTPEMYQTKFMVKTVSRLKSIDVVSNGTYPSGNLVRRYQLAYDTDTLNNVTLLSTITQIGSDQTSTLPPINFSYSKTAAGNWNAQSRAGGPNLGINLQNYNNPATQCLVGDFDGNAKTDIACFLRIGGEWAVGLSNSGGWNTPTWTGGASPAFTGGDNWAAVYNDCLTGDFNGDGKTDIVCNSNYFPVWRVALSTGNGWSTTDWPGGPSIPYPLTDYCLTGDFNGDGKTDIACGIPGTTSTNVMLSTGNSWNTTTWNNGPTLAGYTIRTLCGFGDFDGDGKTDIMCEANSTGWNVFLARGDHWESAFWAASNLTPRFSRQWATDGSSYWIVNVFSGCLFGDFNGDGKTDVACYNRDNDTWTVGLATGSGWSSTSWPGTSTIPIKSINYYNGGETMNRACSSLDFNGDGMTDILCYNSDNHTFRVALSSGSGFITRDQVLGPAPNLYTYSKLGSYPNDNCKFGDFFGSGRIGISCFTGDSVNTWVTGENIQPSPAGQQAPADLLYQETNGVGRTRTYSFFNSSDLANLKLSFNIPVLGQTVVNDGNGVVSTTKYTYSGGFYYAPERDFRGFNYEMTSGPVGPHGEQKIVETWFHQGNDLGVDQNDPNVSVGYLKGKPYRLRTSDITGVLFEDMTLSYISKTNSPYYDPLSTVVTAACEISPCKVKQDSFDYDGYGNTIVESHYGDLSVPDDDKTIKRTFSPNMGSWIVGLPSNETIYQGVDSSSLVKLSSADFYYDGNSPTPTVGNITRIVHWGGGGGAPDPEDRIEYDLYGNPTSRWDANGNRTYTSYDNSNTFPTVQTNPLGHQTITQYYGVDTVPVTAGKGYYGLVQSVKDPNYQNNSQAITTYEYDPFGRKSKVTLPAINSPGGVVTHQYNAFGTVGTQHILTTYPEGMIVKNYFDGLGRTFLEQKTGPDNSTISVQKIYDSNGFIYKTSLPDFGSPSKWTTYHYDAIGRLIKTIHPDDSPSHYSQTLKCYSNWSVVSIDENLHRKRETFDSSGNVIKVEEYVSTYPQPCSTSSLNPYAVTTYQYDVLGNLRMMTDAKNNQSIMTYDSLNRMVLMTDPDLGVRLFRYDNVGNLLSQTDSKGHIISYTYDALNRVKTKSYGTGAAPVVVPTITQINGINSNQINLSWSWLGPQTGVSGSGFRIERCQGPNCSNFAPITTILSTGVSASYSDTNLTAAMSYSYRIWVLDNGSVGMAVSNVASATTAPLPPSNLYAQDTPNDAGTAINLTWTPSPSADVVYQYVYRGTAPGGPYQLIWVLVGNTVNSLTDGGLNAGINYYYIIKASDGSSLSNSSNEASAIPIDNRFSVKYQYQTVPYQWIDASVNGNTYFLSDDGNVTIPIGFDFSFYGKIKKNVTISANGFLTFGNLDSSYQNVFIPTPTLPNDMIAPLWNDLNPAAGGKIYSLLQGNFPNRKLTIAWVGIPHYGGTIPGTFEVTLYETSGDIIYQYQDISYGGSAQNATVGVEDSNGTNGASLPGGAGGISNGSAYRFYSTFVGPPGPTSLVAADVPGDMGRAIQLTWTGGPYNSTYSYSLYRSQNKGLGAGGSYTLVTPNAGPGYIDTGLVNGVIYYYLVRAFDSSLNIESNNSNEAKAMPLGPTYKVQTVSYSWTDATSGTPYTLGDDASVTIPIGFTFNFYGVDQSNITISSNGYLTFGGNGTLWNNSPVGLNAIEPFWDDLNPAAGGKIYSLLQGTAPNRQLTIAWVNVPHFGGTTGITFEATLYENSGAISFQYQNVIFGDPLLDYGASATVGVSDPNGLFYTTYSYNQPVIRNGMALQFYRVNDVVKDVMPPSDPANLVINQVGSARVSLGWTPSIDNVGVSSYQIERCLGPGCSNFGVVGTSAVPLFSDTSLFMTTTYNYRVRASDAAGNLSGYSNIVQAATSILLPPTGLTAVDTPLDQGGSITLSWTPSTSLNSAQQRIYRSNSNGGPYSVVGTVLNSTSSSYNDTGLTNGTTYYYVVRAFDGANESANSNQASAVPLDNLAPSYGSVTTSSITTTTVTIIWTTDEVSDSQVEYGATSAYGMSTMVNPSMVINHSVGLSGLTSGTLYHYRVRSKDAAGNLIPSGDYSFNTQAGPDTTAPTVPGNLAVTAISSTQLDFGWIPSIDNTGVDHYEVERSFNNSTYTFIANATTATFSDTTVSSGVTYLYRLRAVDAAGNKSGYSNIGYATTIVFTDNPTIAGITFIKAAHVTELRQAVNSVRASVGLAAATWTDPILTGVSVKAVHLQELRNNLNPALTALGFPVPSYTDPTLTAGVTTIKKAHIDELRNGVK